MLNTLLLQAEGAAESPAGGGWQFLLMVGSIIVVFYFFMIRPQQKRQKQEANFRDNLQKGDRVITLGGIYGRIVSVEEGGTILVEVDNGVKLKVDKAALKPAPDPSTAKK